MGICFARCLFLAYTVKLWKHRVHLATAELWLLDGPDYYYCIWGWS